jgi:hypothetical protein
MLKRMGKPARFFRRELNGHFAATRLKDKLEPVRSSRADLQSIKRGLKVPAKQRGHFFA